MSGKLSEVPTGLPIPSSNSSNEEVPFLKRKRGIPLEKIPPEVARLLVGLSLMVSGCQALPSLSNPESTPTPPVISEPFSPPSPEPSLTEAPTTPQPTPTVEGPTIVGETLAIGGTQLELVTTPGDQLAQQIGARERGWTVVTDENGNSSFFTGYAGPKGKEVQTVVLAQGPQGFEWDGENMIWRQNNQVFIPDILLPGGWNEEKQMAGPAHEAETVFLFRDDGSYRVGVLYSPEAVAQIPDKSNLEILPDGRGLFIGVQKNFDLQTGQNIVRDNDDNLRLVDPSGNYLLMITSWENVTSPNQLYQAGAFAGPIEAMPEIPYPSQEFIKNLGIENPQQVAYKVIAEKAVMTTTVADDKGNKKEIIVAQATTNEEGQFKGWQTTVPLAAETGLVVPNPRATNPELFDLTNPDAPIPQFVNGMKEAEIEITTEQVASTIDYQVLNDKDGKPFIIGSYNLDPNPNQTGETLEGPVPLFIAEQDENGEWRWREFGLVKFDNRHSLALDEWDRDIFRNSVFKELIVNIFGTVFPTGAFMPRYVEQYGDGSERFFIDLVKHNPSLSLYVHPGFWDLNYPSSLDNNPSKEKIIQEMKRQVRHNLEIVQEIRSVGGAPVKINFINEPWWADPPNNPINVGWKTYSIYNEPYGTNLIIESYLMYYKEAQKMGLESGKDFHLILSVDGIFFPNKKLDFVLYELLRAKKEIGHRLDMDPSQVPLELALQWRFDKNVTGPKTSNEGRYKLPTQAEIEGALKRIRDFERENGIEIPLHVTEFEMVNLAPRERQALMEQLVEIAFRYDVKDITYGSLARSWRNPTETSQNPWIDPSVMSPTSYYYQFLQNLYTHNFFEQ